MKIKVVDKLKCDICDVKNDENIHYCVNCGNNLSDKTELTDVLFFIARLINWFGKICLIFTLITVWPFLVMCQSPFTKCTFFDTFGVCFLPSLFMFVISFFIKLYSIKRCRKNLYNLGGSNEKN